jgi:signal transduction histidine kinase
LDQAQALLDDIPAPILAMNERGVIVLWNRCLEAVTGIPASQMIGTPGQAWLGDGSQGLPLKDGGRRSVRWTSSMLPASSSSQLTYAVGVDVADENEVHRRTARAERLAALGMLAAGLAHEVRNPLNSATLQLQLLERRLDKGKLDAEAVVSTLRVVKAEILRLDRLVTDFLEFAHPAPGRRRPTDLVALAKDVVDSMKVEARSSGVELTTKFAPGLDLVRLEATRVRQVLLNLLKNSLDALAGSGGTITLRIEVPPHSTDVRLEVEDNGPGFATEAPVFDAFYTTKAHGTGLGLSIVHRIVSEHGGKVDCRSVPGSTCFSISLPLANEVEDDT